MTNEKQILLPDIGDFDAVDIIEIAVSVGDTIEQEETLVTLESDKATMDIPCPYSGTVKAISVKVGDKVAEGAPIALIEAQSASDGEADSGTEVETTRNGIQPDSDAAPETHTPTTSPPVETAPAAASKLEPTAPGSAPIAGAAAAKEVYASPSVRRFAHELGVNLALIQGSGRKGRILKEDVKAFTKSVLSNDKPASAGGFVMPEWPSIDFSKFGAVETKPLSRIKRLGGQNLHRNWVSIPSVTQFDEADITDLEAFRKARTEVTKEQGIKLTLVAFLVKAAVHALQHYPEFNASLTPDGENIVVKKYFHIGVAVNTDNGLMVPVIQNADKKGVVDIAREISTLSDAARQGKINPGALQGGCFTISSLGGIGGLHFTPIVNAPEVAILGVSRATIRPVYVTGECRPRLIMPFALSYDHRVIDGVAGAQFTQFLRAVLTDIRDILL